MTKKNFKTAIVSHSYLEPENQKNILALNDFCSVRCIVPRYGQVLLFRNYKLKKRREIQNIFSAYHPIYASKYQYILASLTMGLFEFKPDIIIIEYNPWALVVLQVLLYRRIFCPQAIVACTVKKNTYRLRPGLHGKMKKLLVRFTIKRITHFIVASDMVSQLYQNKLEVPKRKLSVCHHLGVDVTLFSPLSGNNREVRAEEDSVVVGYCGRFDDDKGVRDLFDAVCMVRKSVDQPVVLRLMGCGIRDTTTEKYLKEKSQSNDWLEILPPVSNAEVADFLRGLDIFVMASHVLDDHEEHDAHALLEAMACGLACIGTISGIIPEILEGNVGCLVSPENPNELCAALASLIRTPIERANLSLRARKKALKEFSLRAIAKRKHQILIGITGHC